MNAISLTAACSGAPMGCDAEIEAVEMSLSGLVVRYKFVNYATFNVNKPVRPTVPYRIRIIPRTIVPVQFEQTVEREDAPARSKSKEKK